MLRPYCLLELIVSLNLHNKQSMRILENTPKEPDKIFHIKKKKYYNQVPSTTRSRTYWLTGVSR